MEALAGEDIKDGAPFWALYSGLLWVVPTNTGIFFARFKTIWANHAFFRDDKASIWKKTSYVALYFSVF